MLQDVPAEKALYISAKREAFDYRSSEDRIRVKWMQERQADIELRPLRRDGTW